MPRPVKQTADPVGMGASFEDNSGRLLGREPPPERAWVGGHGGFFHYLSLRVKHAAVRFAVPEIYSHGQFALKPVCGRVIHDQPPSIWATSPSLDWGPYRYPGRLAFSSHLSVWMVSAPAPRSGAHPRDRHSAARKSRPRCPAVESTRPAPRPIAPASWLCRRRSG